MITRAAEAEGATVKEESVPHPAPEPAESEERSPKKAKLEETDSADSPPKPSPKSKVKTKATGQVKDKVERRTVKEDKRVHRTGQAKAGEEPPHSLTEITGKDMNRRHGVLERGHIYFFYRPRVEHDEAHSINDIARFSILPLPNPTADDESTPVEDRIKPYRYIVVGKKRLPDVHAAHEVLWGSVTSCGDNLSSLKEELGSQTYQTQTLGERHLSPARCAGRGRYVLSSEIDPSAPKGSKNMSAVYRTFLAYALSIPHELGEVQKELNIELEAAYTLQVKNPEKASNHPRVGNQASNRMPVFPSLLLSFFTTKFIPSNPPHLLNYPGAELLFIASNKAPVEQVGEAVVAELEDGIEEEIHDFEEKGKEAAVKELGLDEESVVVEALDGRWV